MKKSLKFELLLLFTALIWGVGFPVTKIAVNTGFQTFTILSGRFVIASVLLALGYRKHLKFIDIKHMKYGLIAGLVLFAGFVFQTYGIMFTVPSKNAFITQMMVILVPFLSWMVYKKRPDKFAFIGAFIALMGGLILTYDSSIGGGLNKGDVLTFGCALMVATHIIISSHIAKKESTDLIAFTLVQFFVAAVLSLGLALLLEDVPRETSVINWWPLIFMGVLNTAFGFTIQTFAHKYSTPTKASIIVSTEAVFASVASVLMIGEPVTVQMVVGGLFVFIAVITVETKWRFIYENSKV
jgi:drug/metabolite transporter (DMT)-like permease